jgi:hypothetical protein
MNKTNKQRLIFYPLFLLFIGYILLPRIQAKYFDNSFDLSDMLINPEEVYKGGPPKDGIPSIDSPKFVKANKAYFLSGDDWVLGLSINGIEKAYPIKIMDHHEIINDQFSGSGVVITYCQLCGSGTAFSSNVTFCVSGLLYNNDVLLYDRETHSLWSQILSQAVSGELMGEKLDLLALTHTRWDDWKTQYPDTLVLSTDTGFKRNYDRSPYIGYEKNTAIYFPLKNIDKRYHPKQRVIGVEINNQFKAYPFIELEKQGLIIKDNIANTTIIIEFDTNNQSPKITDLNGVTITTITSYWLAWMAFHPNSDVFISTL